MNHKIHSKTGRLHMLLNIVSWGIFLVSLIRMLVAYGSFPEEIGVHFGPDGNFDVIANKIFAFYPYLVSLIMLLFCQLSAFLVGKLKTGLRISEKGEELLKTTIRVFVDIFTICTVTFFSGIWVDCVIKQQAMNTTVPMIISYVYIVALITFLIAVIAIRVKNVKKEI